MSHVRTNYDTNLILYFGILHTQPFVSIKRRGKVAVVGQIHRIILQEHTTQTTDYRLLVNIPHTLVVVCQCHSISLLVAACSENKL